MGSHTGWVARGLGDCLLLRFASVGFVEGLDVRFIKVLLKGENLSSRKKRAFVDCGGNTKTNNLKATCCCIATGVRTSSIVARTMGSDSRFRKSWNSDSSCVVMLFVHVFVCTLVIAKFAYLSTQEASWINCANIEESWELWQSCSVDIFLVTTQPQTARLKLPAVC